jgi:hypothetical protein
MPRATIPCLVDTHDQRFMIETSRMEGNDTPDSDDWPSPLWDCLGDSTDDRPQTLGVCRETARAAESTEDVQADECNSPWTSSWGRCLRPVRAARRGVIGAHDIS